MLLYKKAAKNTILVKNLWYCILLFAKVPLQNIQYLWRKYWYQAILDHIAHP